jgi:CHAT domain-containing protein
MIDEAEAQLAHVSAKAGGIGEASGLRSRHVEWGRVAQNLTALEIAGSEPGSDRHRKAIEDGFQAAGRWKGQALLEGIVEHWSGGRNRRSIELRREIDERTSQRRDVLDRLSAGIREGVDDEALDELRTLTDDLAREIETLSDEWERMSTGDDGLTIPRGVSTADVRAVLDESTALIEFAEGTRALYGYAIGPTNARFVELGDRAAIVEKIDGYLGGISGPARLSSARELHERGRSLSELLLKPLLTDLPQTVDRLVIVPSAQLAGIAFEALVVGPDRPSEAIQLVDLQFVIDRYEVAYVPSSPVLVELGEGGSRTKPGRVLVLADPLYSGSPGVPAAEPSPSPLALLGRSRARLAADLPRLEKTRTEALVLVRLLAESEDESTLAAITSIAERRSGTVEGRLFELRLGQDASRARLLTDLRDYSVVHIAAHGYVDRSLPQRTGIALAYRSDGNDDLTIVDVLDLDLDANLVTLSACETAQGVVRAGEGVQSLARAFLYAGARSVVASLWQVEDRAAAETMEAFYRSALRDGASIGSALRKAKLEVRRGFSRRGVAGSTSLESESDAETAHPFYWAPLVHIGSLGSGPD